MHWYLAQLRPNCAMIAVRNLLRQGFDPFLPLERYTRRRRAQLQNATRPYFAGYLFIGTHRGSAHWRTIGSTQGISRLVTFASKPEEVPTQIIDEIRDACDEEGVVVRNFGITEGDHIKVESGPFTGLMGRVERLAPQERAWVLLDILGSQSRTLVARRDTRPMLT